MKALLDNMKKENDIKKIPEDKLDLLAKEIRRFLIQRVSRTGGHLASNLGVVDLTIALHSVLDLPEDKIVWDVGHQAYTHKILTGRKEAFATLRFMNGLSGFPKTKEHPADAFNTGHSSTSISAALGIAMANQLEGNDHKVAAVIGDGALTGGMALEALNNVSSLKRNFVIILNDNEMSIAKNVGGLSQYLKFVVKDGFFHDLGITYIGPIDGHDIAGMRTIFSQAFALDHPVIIHVKTKKGKGYKPAEENPTRFHGVAPFQMKTGEGIKAMGPKTYTEVFSEYLVEKAKTNEKILAITAAMPDGTGLSRFKKAYPDRFFDVGIAEQHGVTFAAGLAIAGYRPVISLYSSFYQRAYDQVLHDVCLQNLPVTFIIDRAGLVGEDGETHQGIFDISFLSAIPNITILAPKNGEEIKKSLDFALTHPGPVAIRFPKGKDILEKVTTKTPFAYGTSSVDQLGHEIAILSVGTIMEEVVKCGEMLEKEGVKPTIVDARFLKPLDTKMLDWVMENHKYIIIVEEAIKRGGYGEAVEQYCYENGFSGKISTIAIEDQFVEQGKIIELREMLGMTANGIYEKIKNMME